MAEDSDTSQTKTEQPTERKLQKLREDSHIPRSKEFTSSFVILISMISAVIFFSSITESIANFTRACLQFENVEASDVNWMFGKMHPSRNIILGILCALFLISFFSAFISSILVGGWLFNAKVLEIKLERISLIRGLKRILSTQFLIELLKNLLKVSVILITLCICIFMYHKNLIKLNSYFLKPALYFGFKTLTFIILILTITYFLVSTLDIPLQLFLFSQKSMMTQQEVKESRREEELNPEIRQRIKSTQQKLSNQRMLNRIPEANVIITNPTHFAVAVKYDENTDTAPIIIAKGADHLATLIITLAKKRKCPIMMNPMLARALYHHVEVGEMVPTDLYVALAKILAHIRQLNDYRRGLIDQSPEVPVVEVPERYRNNP